MISKIIMMMVFMIMMFMNMMMILMTMINESDDDMVPMWSRRHHIKWGIRIDLDFLTNCDAKWWMAKEQHRALLTPSLRSVTLGSEVRLSCFIGGQHSKSWSMIRSKFQVWGHIGSFRQICSKAHQMTHILKYTGIPHIREILRVRLSGTSWP